MVQLHQERGPNNFELNRRNFDQEKFSIESDRRISGLRVKEGDHRFRSL